MDPRQMAVSGDVSCGSLEVSWPPVCKAIVSCGDYHFSCKKNILRNVKHRQHQTKSPVGRDRSTDCRKDIRTPTKLCLKSQKRLPIPDPISTWFSLFNDYISLDLRNLIAIISVRMTPFLQESN